MDLFMAVTLDRYQLPLFIGTRKEVAQWANLSPDNISAYVGRGLKSYKNGCKFIKVTVTDAENSD